LSVASQIPTGVALITTVPNGENTIIIEPGANAQLTPEDVEQAEELFEDAGIVLMQLETPVTTLIKAAELAKQHGAYVVLNPAPAPVTPLPDALLQHVDLLIPNETEAAAISGTEVVTTDDVPGAMERLHSMGIKNVIITLGSKGAYASVEGSIMKVEAEKVEAVDTTAAGDTFCGALCKALLHGRDLQGAMSYACKAAAISVTRRGAQMSMPRKEEIVE
jgi:ribokinase